jgi:hypothetical protein
VTYSEPIEARPLTDREREVLDFMLAVDDPRIPALREQARSARVIGQCTCGCATIDLEVDRDSGTPANLRSPAVSAFRRMGNVAPEASVFELLLFLDDGWLSSLEIVYHTADPKPIFPPSSAFDPPEVTSWQDHGMPAK